MNDNGRAVAQWMPEFYELPRHMCNCRQLRSSVIGTAHKAEVARLTDSDGSSYAIQPIRRAGRRKSPDLRTRVTSRLFEAGIEPDVSVDVFGTPEMHNITITNDAGCALSELTLSISVGYSRGSEKYPVRRCIYTRNWRMVPGGAVLEVESPIDIGTDNDLPEGVQVDSNDLQVNYTFVRTADRKRYCFKFNIGFLRQSDGKRIYTRIGEPERVRTLKAHILRRVKATQSAI